jgi:FtsH-binding integral membrane protein
MNVSTWVRAQWDRIAAWLLIAAGLVALLVGWWGVSHTAYLAEQMPYLVSAGMFGLFLLGLGATIWISADLRDEWRKLDDVADLLRDHDGAPADLPPQSSRATVSSGR